MAYTPITGFSPKQRDYTPNHNFSFSQVNNEADVSATLDGIVGTYQCSIINNSELYSSNTIYEFDTTSYVDKFPTYDFDGGGFKGRLSATLDGITGVFETGIVLVGDVSATLDGISGNAIGYVNQSADFAVTLRGAISDIEGNGYFNQCEDFAVTLDDLSGIVSANYDPNVDREFVRGETLAVAQSTSRIDSLNLNASSALADFKINTECSTQENTKKKSTKITVVNLNGTITNPEKIESIVEIGTDIRFKTCFVTEQGTITNPDTICSVIEESTDKRANKTCSVVEQMTKVYPDRWEVPYQDSSQYRHDSLKLVYYEPDVGFRYNPPHRDTIAFDIGTSPDAESNIFNFEFGNPTLLAEGHSQGIYTSKTCTLWGSAKRIEHSKCSVLEESSRPDQGVSPWLDPVNPDPVNPDPPTGISHIVPIQEVYIMQNTILVTLDDGVTEIHLDRIGLNIDGDSYAWNFSANLLDPSQKLLIIQNADGTAKIIHVTINGYTWHLLVEKIATTKRFGEKSISISGRSLTALMAKPYNQIGSVNFGSILTNQQIVDQILPLGWTAVWDMPVWNISAGAYGYQNKTIVDALKEMADMMGSSIVPTRDSQEITFRSRYPVSPWNFDVTTADVVITDDAILELTEEPSARYNGNGVYVHGTETGGQLGFVRLSSTVDPSDGSGSRLTPTVSNALMTDANIGIRHLGERILSGQYEQPAIKGFTTFMDGVIVPLIEIGNLVSATIDGVETKGICNSISIQASHVEVLQQITIGDSSPNNWIAFNDLLPKDPLLIATLNSTTGTTSLMTLVDGGVVRVRGTGNVNTKYYIRSGEIVSNAPDLPANNIVLG